MSLALLAASTLSLQAADQKTYEVWDTHPALNRGADIDRVVMGGYPFDQDWEAHSYPIGNGYAGASLFGRTDTDRVQLTEKTLYNSGLYGLGGLTSFMELFLDFNHDAVTNYRRSLNLNEGIAHVSYESDGVTYEREYFMSYPDEVLVIKLKASEKGALSLKVRPEIPYLPSKKTADHKTGTMTVEKDLITLAGTIGHFSLNYEAQVKVLHQGGRLTSFDGAAGDGLEVTDADEATIVVVLGTNYELSPGVFQRSNNDKLNSADLPHDKLTERLEQALNLGYTQLKQRHLADHGGLFDRVSIDLNTQVSELPTPQLLQQYKEGQKDTYLEELMFQYGRYLLIASSREKSLPTGLQGAWSQYEVAPWTGGYWHNINIQMNYWGAMSANLSETFVAYLNYFKGYYPAATQQATDYINKYHPQNVSHEDGENGWTLGTGAIPYKIVPPGWHSGPGTGVLTSKLLMEYYNFTQDHEVLEEVVYPAMRGMSQFLSKTLVAGENNTLLVEPSASPEQIVTDLKQIEGKPGSLVNGKYYATIGCTFDQGAVWENHNDVIESAEILGIEDAFIEQLKAEMPRLDPIIIGDSGQIKEFREEGPYSEIGDPKHRHISHLCTLYPWTLINDSNPDWMQAASHSLDLRGNETTGWAMAHRMNCRARLKEGDQALEVYQKFIAEKTVPNLWTLHPPFQIDGNFGVMSGVAEMLLQSHADMIELLPALPQAWSEGSFDGLVARGNFVVSANWQNGHATEITITSRSGGECRISYLNIAQSTVRSEDGEALDVRRIGANQLVFQTEKGAHYSIRVGVE